MTEKNESTGPASTVTSETEMKERLAAAGQKAEAQKAARRERAVKGSHLLAQLTERATNAGLKTDDKSGFLRITGQTKGRAIYIAKKGGRVDLSGFEVSSPAVTQISAEEAKAKHLGKVRGQLNFNASDEAVLVAYDEALKALDAPAPAPAPRPAKPKAEKKVKPANGAAAAQASAPTAATATTAQA